MALGHSSTLIVGTLIATSIDERCYQGRHHIDDIATIVLDTAPPPSGHHTN